MGMTLPRLRLLLREGDNRKGGGFEIKSYEQGKPTFCASICMAWESWLDLMFGPGNFFFFSWPESQFEV